MALPFQSAVESDEEAPWHFCVTETPLGLPKNP